jgi:hypothetical protein
MLAKDGMVFAADTQMTETSFLKLDAGKVSASIRPIDHPEARRMSGARLRSLAITGAGSAGYLQAARGEFSDLFARNEYDEMHKGLEDGLRWKIEDFHNRHVVPFSNYPSHERPDIWLVIGAQFGDHKQLWSTDRNVLIRESYYAAVGAGATYAKMILAKLYGEVDSVTAALLAAYVVFSVKECIDGCGKDTDIFITKNDLPSFMGRKELRAIEEIFRQYATVESELVLSVLDGSAPESENFKSKVLKQVRSDIAKYITKAEKVIRSGPKGGLKAPPPSQA